MTCFLILLNSMKKRTKKKNAPPSSYHTMPYYFPTEQVDNVGRLRARRKRK